MLATLRYGQQPSARTAAPRQGDTLNDKQTYHHGNLKRALMDQALTLIAERGVDQLSLREVASRAGVSTAAPYHHFPDKASLIRSLALEAMDLMDAEMERAQRATSTDPSSQLLAVGLAYVEFATAHPAYYAALVAVNLEAPPEPSTPACPPEPAGEDGGTWTRLMGAVVACQRAGELPQGDPVVLALHLWSLVHGLAELWRTGTLRQMPQASEGFTPLARQVLSAGMSGLRSATVGNG